MAYNITLTNTSVLTSVADGTSDNTSTSITLIGKNFPSYGTFLNENFVHLLENFANSNAPTAPLPGQLWWDSTSAVLKVNAATTKGSANAKWKVVSSSTSSANEPTNAITGDLWWHTSQSQLKVYSGSSWVVIGPQFTASTGQSGAIADVINGTDLQAHVVVKFYVNNSLIAIMSKDTAFTPADLVSGGLNNRYPVIRPGINFSDQTNPSLLYWGDANQALNLKLSDGTIIPASTVLRGDVPGSISAQFSVLSNNGLILGATAQARLDINSPTNEFRIRSTQSTQNIRFYVNSTTLVATMSGSDGRMTVASDPVTALGVATKQYVDTANVNLSNSVNARISSNLGAALQRNGSVTVAGNLSPAVNNTFSLGNVSYQYANVWATTFRGTSVNAQYADLAEKYLTDQEYEIGTVLTVGGNAEVTACSPGTIAIGVISENPAFLMNVTAAGQPVALKGRVKVRIVGPVTHGQGLTTGENGIAVVANEGQRVFAIALHSAEIEDKFVECIIL